MQLETMKAAAPPAGANASGMRFLQLLIDSERLDLTEGCDRSSLGEALSEILDRLERYPSSQGAPLLVDWLLSRDDVDELYISDDELATLLDRW